MNRCIAVTGCAGFIGRYVTEKLLARGDLVYGIDALTYAADPTLPSKWLAQHPRFKFVSSDINALGAWPDVDAVIHLAAETHVDNSFDASERFFRTNVLGTLHLLEMTRARARDAQMTFVQVSTDEVYGEILEGTCDETAPLNPSSPYAASKAAADCAVLAWGRTYKLPYRIIRPSNCYGLGQYPEKLIPKAVRRMTLGQRIPLHGDGKALRSWLWVDDCANAILAVLDKGRDGQVYNVPGASQASAMEVALWIVRAFGDGDDQERLQFGFERPGLDRRYAVRDTQLEALGWKATGELERDLPALVEAERKTLRW